MLKRHGVRLRERMLLAAVVVELLMASVTLAAPVGQADGTITAVGTETVTITTPAGNQVRIGVTGDTRIIQRRTVTLEDIRPNDFVGVTARREPDGALTAISINIFPPEFKDRVREAQFVMDTGNVMTNATVFQNVRRIEGRTLYLRLAEGSVVIAVPRDAGVVRLTVIRYSDLKLGMRVAVRGTAAPDGGMVATTITVDAQ